MKNKTGADSVLIEQLKLEHAALGETIKGLEEQLSKKDTRWKPGGGEVWK